MGQRFVGDKPGLIRAIDAKGDRDASFVANVVMTHHGGHMAMLRGILRLLETGHTVRCAQFDIDKLVVDGFVVAWADLEAGERLGRKVS